MSDEVCTILVDNGTFMIKSGFAGDCAPRAVYPSIVGISNTNGVINRYVGDEALSKRRLTYHNVFSKGKVVNFDNYEKLLYHNFYNECRVAPEEHPMIFSETTGTESKFRQKTTQIIYESFCVPAFYIQNDNAASLYCSGRTSGVVLNLGQEHSSCTPIYEGELLSHAVTLGSVAGSQIDDYLCHLMKKNDFNINDIHRKEIYRDIKEKICNLALDYDSEIIKQYELPDGNLINIDNKSRMAPEILFKPHMFNIEDQGIDKKIRDSIFKCHSFLEKDLLGNIVLSGGTSMFDGIYQRLNRDLYNHFSSTSKIKVIAPPERKYSVWIGISIIGSLSTFQRQWMSREEYEEHGPMFIEVKCPSSFSEYQQNQKIFQLDFQKVLKSRDKGNISIHFN